MSCAPPNRGVGRLVAITLISSAPVVPETVICACDAGAGTSVTVFAGTRLVAWYRFGNSIVVEPSGPTFSTVT